MMIIFTEPSKPGKLREKLKKEVNGNGKPKLRI